MQKERATADRRPPVIVFTCGRTGSTLLIRMLNCLPETIMWGEHNGALKPLLSSYSRLRDVADNRFVAQAAKFLQPVYEREPILNRQGMSIEWLNWFSAADIDRLYRELITGLFYPDSVRERFSRWGFKEIQYRDAEFALLRNLFSGMKAIILYRNPAAVFASQFRNFAKNDSERLPKVLNNIEGYYKFAALHAGEQHEADPPLFISYEEIADEFTRSVLKLQTFVDEDFSNSIKEIEKDIKHFRKRRRPAVWSGNPLEDFEQWQQTNNTRLPQQKLQLIADHYDTVVKATRARAEAVGADQ